MSIIIKKRKNTEYYLMRVDDGILILKKTLFFLLLFFVISVIGINLIKVIFFSVKIQKVISEYQSNNHFKSVDYDDEKYQPLNEDKKHEALLFGYKNDLYELNGSEWGDGINILLVGSDKKNFTQDKSRADVIIVIRITSSGKVLSISIPRDSLIKIRSGKYNGIPDKIGHSLYWGGVENLKESVEELLASPVHRTVIIDDFKSFEAFIALLGGVNVDKTLAGKTALQWIRNRNFRDGDIERCKRQQFFLKKAVEKVWKITKKGNYYYSFLFFNFINKIVKSDLSEKDFKNIFFILKKNDFNPESDFLIGVLPGAFGKYDSKILKRKNLTSWNIDEKVLADLQFLFYSEKNRENYFLNDNVKFLDFIKIDLRNFYKSAKKS